MIKNSIHLSKIHRIGIYFLFLFLTTNLWAQTQGEDYDVMVIPVGPSLSAPGRDLTSSESLEARGLQILTVTDSSRSDVPYDLPETLLEPDRMIINFKPNQAIQILSQWTEGIPVSATSAYFSVIVSSTGEPLQQAALAMLDADNPTLEQGVSISYNLDIPVASREYSLEYRNSPGKVLILMQAVGPTQGEAQLILERMRFLDGYRELDLSLGSTAVSVSENFASGIDSVIVNKISGYTDGYIGISSENHQQFPSVNNQSLLLATLRSTDVIQALIPLQMVPGALEENIYPRRFYSLASIKRLSGEQGNFTVALASGSTTSVGYENHPISSLPLNEWEEVQSPIQFTEEGANPVYLIVQIQGGPASLAVDDVSIQARRDSMYLWDASQVPGLIKE